MLELLLAGCSDTELSYDAFIDGRYNGAMSRYAINAIRANPNATFNEFYAVLRQSLPYRDYPQTPQLEGSEANNSRELFEPLPVEGPGPEPEPPGCLMGLM